MDKEIIATVVTAISGAVATVIAALIGVRIGSRPEKENPKYSYSPEAIKRSHGYDIFVSSPLAGFSSDEEIKKEYSRIAPVVDCLENELKFRVFWAGRNIHTRANFDDPGISAIDDIETLKNSKYFILFYQSKIASSVLYEAGIALRSCLISIYVVKHRNDLPFLMTSASDVFSNVRIYKTTLPDEMLILLRKHGRRLFEEKTD